MEKPNIVLAITDCLRYDSLENMRIKKLMSGTILNSFAVAPSTFFSVPSIMTGTFPFSVIKNATITQDISTYLPLLAALSGYQVTFITANIVTSRAYGYYVPNGEIVDFMEIKRDLPQLKDAPANRRRVFSETVKERLKARHPEVFKRVRSVYQWLRWSFTSGKKLVSQSTYFEYKVRANMINETIHELIKVPSKRPKFIVAHFMDTHTPYGAPSLSFQKLREAEKLSRKMVGFPEKLSSKDVSVLKELYLGEAGFLDSQLVELAEMVENYLGLDNTLITILSDHGEAFGENGFFNHRNDALIEEVLHVPLGFIGDAVKRIKVLDKGMFSSYNIHKIIGSLILGEPLAVANRTEQVHAVGYVGKSLKREYEPSFFCSIDKTGIKKVRIDKSQETESMFSSFLEDAKRNYLRATIQFSKKLGKIRAVSSSR